MNIFKAAQEKDEFKVKHRIKKKISFWYIRNTITIVIFFDEIDISILLFTVTLFTT